MGNFLWSFQYPLVDPCNYFTLIEATDRGIILLGTTWNGDNTVLFKVDNNGNLIWRIRQEF